MHLDGGADDRLCDLVHGHPWIVGRNSPQRRGGAEVSAGQPILAAAAFQAALFRCLMSSYFVDTTLAANLLRSVAISSRFQRSQHFIDRIKTRRDSTCADILQAFC